MKPVHMKTKFFTALLLGGILAAGPAMADKPSWAGSDKSDKGGKNERGERHDDKREDKRGDRRDDDRKSDQRGERNSDGDGRHFKQQQYTVVREYYGEQYRGRRCPPGLAKKNNGCMPPGQAKKWKVGQPLPREVIYYTVPAPLVVKIGPPPSGHRYVRVAGDILMIAIGTGMVVDAIQDLGGM